MGVIVLLDQSSNIGFPMVLRAGCFVKNKRRPSGNIRYLRYYRWGSRQRASSAYGRDLVDVVILRPTRVIFYYRSEKRSEQCDLTLGRKDEE